jgi:hypothetical protein
MSGVLFGLAAAFATSALPAPEPSNAANTVAELRILPHAEYLPAKRDIAVRPPRIVSTFPRQGRTVRPGLLVVRITFDRPMTCDGALHNDETLMPACSDGRQDLILSF